MAAIAVPLCRGTRSLAYGNYLHSFTIAASARAHSCRFNKRINFERVSLSGPVLEKTDVATYFPKEVENIFLFSFFFCPLDLSSGFRRVTSGRPSSRRPLRFRRRQRQPLISYIRRLVVQRSALRRCERLSATLSDSPLPCVHC